MWDLAFAQAAPGPLGPSTLISLMPLILVFIIFYFLLIRPQQKKVKQHRDMVSRLKRNDEVMTSGGIYGKVMALTDSEVTLEVAPNVRIKIHRPQISAFVGPQKGEKGSGKSSKKE